MELDPLFGGRRGTAYDPFSLDVWDPFYFPGAIWDVQTPRYRYEGQGGQDTITAAHTQVDWKETPDAHIFKADLPGLKKEDIKIHVEDGRVLEISGERSKEDVEKNDKWHRVERQHGSFLRRFRLPENAKVDKVKVNVKLEKWRRFQRLWPIQR